MFSYLQKQQEHTKHEQRSTTEERKCVFESGVNTLFVDSHIAHVEKSIFRANNSGEGGRVEFGEGSRPSSLSSFPLTSLGFGFVPHPSSGTVQIFKNTVHLREGFEFGGVVASLFLLTLLPTPPPPTPTSTPATQP